MSSYFTLPSDLRHSLCTQLEIDKAAGSGWENVCSELGLKSSYIDFLKSQSMTLKSSAVLDVFESRYNVQQSRIALEELKNIFINVGEGYCSRLLEEELERDNERDDDVFLPGRFPVEHEYDGDSGVDISVVSV